MTGDATGGRATGGDATGGAGPLRSICIVGGGTAGWSAAALLARVLRGSGCRITLVESSAIPTVGVGEATIPPIFDFLHNIGADEVEFIRRCQATFKLGIRFRDWLHPGHEYWHPFGSLGVTINRRPFHHYYCRTLAEGHGETLADLCPAAALAEDGKFAFPSPDGQWPGGAVAYALHFDAGLVAAFLRDHAERAGVERLDRRIVGARRGEGETIAAIAFDDGTALSADFYIDCSGFRGLLIEETLGAGFEDWKHWLPCDRAIAAPTAAQARRAPHTLATAQSAGWQWCIPLQHRTGNGLVYASDFIDDADAEAELLAGLDGEPLAQPRVLRFTAGLRRRAWVGNCLAIGLAAGFLEPLESTSIHLIHTGLNRLLDLFPDRGFDPALRAAYNRDVHREYAHIRDFLLLHYAPNRREGEPFWDHMRGLALPDTLAEKIELFERTGRIAARQRELFADINWFYVMHGMGLVPAAIDPLAGAVPAAEVREVIGQLRGAMLAFRRAAPTHDAILARLLDPAETRRPAFGVGAGWAGR
ncbi:tryptophan halogenase [Altererythrobacter marinus]|uniref:Tryptophan halogenase n=1 Tax=Pelagerythrobacter marinus TaxID=538382 RepID=A0ABW9V0E3_9SPHN|nr:tryptophan halogenase family protein [Pelagerythrobacter marinus]MXO69510.1 tryptophan halogenase [Pelagerythrobacter marinus]